jgi:acyl carrier protein
MTPDQAQHVIEDALAQVAPDVDMGGITPDTDLRDDLGLDSLDFLRFVEILSERTGTKIAEDDYPHLATLASAVKWLAGG